MRLTEAQALELSSQLAQEVVDRESARRADPYDAESYTWRSHDRVGNTLPEIQDIRAYGYPLHHGVDENIGALRYRGYQYEEASGFLKGSAPYLPVNSDIDEGSLDMFEILSLAPEAAWPDALVNYEPVVHKTKGPGYLIGSEENACRVFFTTLPTSTVSCRVGANIKWVKRENLL